LNLASENAKHAFEEKRRAADDIDERLKKMQQRLRLAVLPRRIECSDISHLGGKDTVGSVVSFYDGAPDKKRYRTYKVHSAEPGDDYAAMFEVLGRRFRRGATAAEEPSDKDPWELPDLFVVDGGPGQLSVALAAAHDLGLFDLCIVALAKEKERPMSEKVVDRVYLPGQKNPISLRANSAELFILAHARDEAHRFANRGRKRAGKKRRFESALDKVPGVGVKTRTALLTKFGSIAAIRAAGDDELRAAGLKAKQISALRATLA
jgi:excinuclease ABC subunit C